MTNDPEAIRQDIEDGAPVMAPARGPVIMVNIPNALTLARLALVPVIHVVVDGCRPDRGDAQVLQVGQAVDDPLQVAAVVVARPGAVEETARPGRVATGRAGFAGSRRSSVSSTPGTNSQDRQPFPDRMRVIRLTPPTRIRRSADLSAQRLAFATSGTPSR